MDINKLLDNARGLCKAANDKELAHRLGVTPPAISNYRNGRALPDVVVCEKLAKITGDSPRQVIASMYEARARSAAEKAVWRRLATAAALALAVLPSLHSAPAKADVNAELAMHYAKLRARLFLGRVSSLLRAFRAECAATVTRLSHGTAPEAALLAA